MPADARGHARKLPSGKWQLRWYDRDGRRRSGGAFPSKSAALNHYRDVIEPGLNGRAVARRDLTYSELVQVFLERHAIVAKPRTIAELRWRLKQSEEKFGDVPLAELERMADEVAGYAGDDLGATPLPAHGRIPSSARGWYPLRLHDPEPGEASGAEPDAGSSRDSHLHPGRVESDCDRARPARGSGGQVRSSDGATSR